jgi:hypothetical protein
MGEPELRPIPSAPGYFADSSGRIRKPQSKKGNGEPYVTPFGRGGTRNHYLSVSIKTTRGWRCCLVHRLVAEAFCAPEGVDINTLTVDHINNDHVDNRPENLEFVTLQENKRRYWQMRREMKQRRKDMEKVFKQLYEAAAPAADPSSGS